MALVFSLSLLVAAAAGAEPPAKPQLTRRGRLRDRAGRDQCRRSGARRFSAARQIELLRGWLCADPGGVVRAPEQLATVPLERAEAAFCGLPLAEAFGASLGQFFDERYNRCLHTSLKGPLCGLGCLATNRYNGSGADLAAVKGPPAVAEPRPRCNALARQGRSGLGRGDGAAGR